MTRVRINENGEREYYEDSNNENSNNENRTSDTYFSYTEGWLNVPQWR